MCIYIYTTHDISKNQHVHWKIPVSASFCTFDFYCMNISLWYPRKILMTSITAQDHPPPGTGKAMELSQTQRWEPEIGGGLRGCCEKKALNYEENWDFNHKNIVLKHKESDLTHHPMDLISSIGAFSATLVDRGGQSVDDLMSFNGGSQSRFPPFDRVFSK